MTAAAELAIRQIDTVDLIPTPQNPRRIDRTASKFLELVGSVRARGILVPLIARPHPEQEGKFDLRAGHRRLAAAEEAGLTNVPVIVREMTDVEAMEVTVLENLQREDLNPLEEARGVLNLLSTGASVLDVAEKIGKSPQWCLRRAKLADLSPSWMAAVDGGQFAGGQFVAALKNAPRFAVKNLELLALYPREVQERVFQKLEENRSFNLLEPGRGDQFANWMASDNLFLKTARFDTKAGGLVPGAGACTKCPKRSSCNPGLFDDEMDPKKIAKDDRCLDAACYRAKEAAALEASFDALKRKHKNLVRYAPEWSNDIPEDCLRSYEATEVPAETPNAVPALAVTGTDAGRLVWIERRGQSARAAPPVVTLRERREQLAAMRKLVAGHAVISDLESIPLPKEINSRKLLALVAAFGSVSAEDRIEFEGSTPFEMAEEFAAGAAKSLDTHVWDGVKPMIAQRLEIHYASEVSDEWWADVNALADLLGVKLATAAAKKRVPEPASWEGLGDEDAAEAPVMIEEADES